jgi:phage tail-like protein
MNNDGLSFYLNRDNRWLDFHWHGLEQRGDGALQLDTLPHWVGDLPVELATLKAPRLPSGVVADTDGTIYFSDPEGARVWKIDACDGQPAIILGQGGEGNWPTQFRGPRGLLIHPTRHTLFVADSGNHRVQVFHLHTRQLVDIWGQADRSGELRPGSAPGIFNTPIDLAADPAGNVYVVDYRNRRVQKFDERGHVMPAFWTTARQQLAIWRPSAVAVATIEGQLSICVFDRKSQRVVVLDPDGHVRHTVNLFKTLRHPSGLAVTATAIYIGDNHPRRLLTFKLDGSFAGEAHNYAGPVAAAAIDHSGNVIVHPGAHHLPLRLNSSGAFARHGCLWGGPFDNPSNRVDPWHRLKALIEPLPFDAHVQLFVRSSLNPNDPPVDLTALEPFPETHWRSLPLDAAECVFAGAPRDKVWIGLVFSSEGHSSAVLPQLQLDFDHQSYLSHLPSVYREDATARLSVLRVLSLVESLYDEAEDRIAALPQLFDPQTAPLDALPWLAGWLAIDFDERWPEAKKRQAIAQAFELHTWRGTPEGLRRALRFYTGVEAHIEEPITQATWWGLAPEGGANVNEVGTSLLGFTTRLAPAEAQGAVVGTTAILDQSHLITDEEFGAPLFADVAHQFTVSIYRGAGFTGATLDAVRAVLDREKPAHTLYQLCTIEPAMSVGWQARLGIDSIVAGTSPPTRLGNAADVALGGEPPGHIGERSQVGQTTYLASST